MNIIGSAVLLTVGDPAASSRFFTAHLGFREVLVTESVINLSRDDTATDLVVLRRDPGPSPEARRPDAREQPDVRDQVVVCFTVTDLAADHERLRREGAPITMPLRQEPWGERVLRLTDPNGVVIQLVEWMPPAGA